MAWTIQKRKALETNAAKCTKIGNFSLKQGSHFVVSNNDNETGTAGQILPVNHCSR